MGRLYAIQSGLLNGVLRGLGRKPKSGSSLMRRGSIEPIKLIFQTIFQGKPQIHRTVLRSQSMKDGLSLRKGRVWSVRLSSLCRRVEFSASLSPCKQARNSYIKCSFMKPYELRKPFFIPLQPSPIMSQHNFHIRQVFQLSQSRKMYLCGLLFEC